MGDVREAVRQKRAVPPVCVGMQTRRFDYDPAYDARTPDADARRHLYVRTLATCSVRGCERLAYAECTECDEHLDEHGYDDD